MKIWKVHFCGEYDYQNRFFSSAEKAYEFMTKSLYNANLKFKFRDDLDLRKELDDSYEFDKERFNVLGYVSAVAIDVDIDVESEDN